MGFTCALYSVNVYLVRGYYVRGLYLFEGCRVRLSWEVYAAGVHPKYSSLGREVVICYLGGLRGGGKSHTL